MNLRPAELGRRLLPQGSRSRRGLTVVGAVALAVALVAILLRGYPSNGSFLAALIAGTPYFLLFAIAGLLLMLLARQWWGVGVAVVIALLAASTQLWLYTADGAPGNAIRVRVMTLNLHVGGADANAVVTEVKKHHVDLLMLEELTEDARQRLKAAGLDDLLPYHAARRAPGGSGTGLFSHYPLSKVEYVAGYTYKFVTAKVWLPKNPGWRNVQAVALHVADPLPDPEEWSRDLRRLARQLPSLSHGFPMIVGGDFNTTPDSARFRDVLDRGFHDAADQAGAGITRTFPANHWFPPLIAIDHVLTRGGPVAVSVSTISIRNSDHRALLATVAVPKD